MCAPEQNAVIWIKGIHHEGLLTSVERDLNEGKPPISVKFEIPYFSNSGFQVSHGQGGRGFLTAFFLGEGPEDHREVLAPGPVYGEVHHSAEDSMCRDRRKDNQERGDWF